LQPQDTLTPSVPAASVSAEIVPRATASSRSTRTILLVDDVPDALAIGRLLLAGQGFEVITAEDAAAALQRIAESKPDLIITDLIMPGMNGLEFCRTLRERADTRAIPIILYTGTELTESVPGPYSVLVTKPTEPKAFINTIRALLAVSSA
jgi:two-component system, OmpR family, alkaline phosphatase synthesis response regulator PhoP